FLQNWNGAGTILPHGEHRAAFAISEFGIKPSTLTRAEPKGTDRGENRYFIKIGDAQSNDVVVARPPTTAPAAWGEPKGRLRTRLSLATQTLPAGAPIPVTLEVENAHVQVQDTQAPAVLNHEVLRV